MKNPIDSDGAEVQPTIQDDPTTAGRGSNEADGAVIGRYKLLEKIGEGGFGAVWMAEQREPVKRRVALKIVKLGMDTRQVVARFEAERQALALMDHPCIAKVLDAGATESGRPYFAMELVRGIPITVYCDQNQLPTQARLELFIQVCHAIQHAHQKGIIHRDIKPSNILVTLHDGVPVPKVIDFGIAKATQQDLTDKTLFTRFQQFVGTPAYMSPEQAEMSGLDVDTRSDIYGLGVLLYELLTGGTPFDSKQLAAAGIDEMRRIIREQEPLRPSTRLSQMAGEELTTTARRHHTEPPRLIHSLKGDLDWVVMKCLEKDRTRRYETANGLALDVQRYLNDEPVLARPPSQVYRLRKLIRRNRALAAGILAVGAALVFGLALSTWMYSRERDARERAVAAELEQARQRAEAEAARMAEAQLRERAERGEAAAAEAAHALQKSAETARLNLYVANLNIAERALQENDLRRAVEHLEAVQPKAGEEDLRGFEWYYLREQCRTHDLFSLREPSGMVEAMDLSPDGRYVAGANMDASVRIWDLQTRRSVLHLTNSTNRLFSVAYSPDGNKVAAADRGTSVTYVWDARSGEILLSPEDLPGATRPLLFSHDSHFLISGLIEQGRTGFQVWRLSDRQPVAFFENGGSSPLAIVADPRADRFIALYVSGHLQFLEGDPLRAVEIVAALGQQPQWYQFFGMDLTADGNLLGLAGVDGSVQLWSVPDRRRLFEIPTGGGAAWAVAFSPDGKKLVSGHEDSSLQVWDTASGTRIGTLRGHHNEVFGLKFIPNTSRLVSCSKDHTIRMWDVQSLAPPAVADLGGSALPLQFSADGQQLAIVSSDGTVGVWSTPDLKPVFRVPHGPVWRFSRSRWYDVVSGGGLMAVKTTNRTVEVWKAFESELVREFTQLSVSQVALSGDGEWLACIDDRGKSRVEEVKSGSLIWEQDLGLTGVRALEILKTSRQLVINLGRAATIWDLDRRTFVTELPGHYDYISGMTATPDEKQLVTATMDGALKVWQTSDWSLLHDLHGHTAIIWSLAISPDGRTLASAGDDNRIRLWNTRTWRLTQTLMTEGVVLRMAFSPRSDWLATGDSSGRVRLFLAPRD